MKITAGPTVDKRVQHDRDDRGRHHGIPASVINQPESASDRAENEAEFANLGECRSDRYRGRERHAENSVP